MERPVGGLTLLETVIATALLAVVVFSLFSLYPGSILSVRRAEQQIQADTLAESCLDDVRAQRTFASLVTGSTESLAPVVRDGVTYRPTLEILAVPGADGRYLKGLRVRVNWDYRGRSYASQHEIWVQSVRP